MAQRAKHLKHLLKGTKRTANQTQASFIKAEDLLGTIEEREAARATRHQRRRETSLRRRS